MRRPRSARLLHFNRANVTAFLSALRTAQSLLEIREFCIPPADMRQQIRICATFMSATGALNHEQILPELVGKALHLEILRHEQYCIYIQSRIATIFRPLLAAKTGLNPREWARKGVPVLQLFSVWPGHSHILVFARHRRVRRAGPTRLPDFVRCHFPVAILPPMDF